MKKRFAGFLAGFLLLTVCGEDSVPSSSSGSNFAHMGRGIVNICTCFLEMPRCMLYRHSEVPFWGLVGGAVEGVGCTVMRAVTGMTDLLFLGYDYGLVFNRDFCPEVWDSPWLPPRKPEIPAKEMSR